MSELDIGLSAELDGIDLGDIRRNRRACKVVEQLGKQPRNSIPSAINGWSETKSVPSSSAERPIFSSLIRLPPVDFLVKSSADVVALLLR